MVVHEVHDGRQRQRHDAAAPHDHGQAEHAANVGPCHLVVVLHQRTVGEGARAQEGEKTKAQGSSGQCGLTLFFCLLDGRTTRLLLQAPTDTVQLVNLCMMHAYTGICLRLQSCMLGRFVLPPVGSEVWAPSSRCHWPLVTTRACLPGRMRLLWTTSSPRMACRVHVHGDAKQAAASAHTHARDILELVKARRVAEPSAPTTGKMGQRHGQRAPKPTHTGARAWRRGPSGPACHQLVGAGRRIVA